MPRFTTMAAVVGLVALAASVALAPAAQATASEFLVHFVTADRNIECEMVDPNGTSGNVTCVLHSKGYTTRGDTDNHGLTARDHPHWDIEYSGAVVVGLSRREIHGPNPARILRYGQTLTVGNFRCSSRVSGLTCISRHSGHGFLLSRAKQQTF
jgi:hypothetical protein